MTVSGSSRSRSQAYRSERSPQVESGAPFRLRFTTDDWKSQTDLSATPTGIGIFYCDISPSEVGKTPIQFTFFWLQSERWEGTGLSGPAR